MPSQALRRRKPAVDTGIAELERKAGEAAHLLKLLANENRLLILCRLVLARELSVNDLVDAVGISQSALSQHLAKMREEGLLATRREAQTVFYRIADPNAAAPARAAQGHLLPVTPSVDRQQGSETMSMKTISPEQAPPHWCATAPC